MKFLLLITVLFTLVQLIVSQEALCEIQETCESCLSAHFNCTWCTDKVFNAPRRCMDLEDSQDGMCNEIIKNEEKLEVLESKDTQDYKINGKKAVQIQPQKVKLLLVKGSTQQIKMTYRPAKNNPLDLYYLMDLSYTMRDDKETLVKIGSELSKALKTFTANYRIGFGSFADKPAMPFINPKLKDNPCASESMPCEPTYGFRHHLPLTDNIKAFVNQVNSSKITANLDNLEGGLDALMQVVVCRKEIGWNERARKIVILVSDGLMHFAGDGKLAGITERNDKTCHLDASGEYEGSLFYDYPSLEEMYRELVKNKISVIFAVTKPVVGTYERIHELMPAISNVGLLSTDSSNILELLKNSYESFVKTVTFEDNSPENIKITYHTNCGGLYKKLKKTHLCTNVEIGKNFDFYINVTLTDFPTDGVYNHKIRIEEAGLSEYLELEVEIQKPCPCTEALEDNSETRSFCSDNGFLHCGMCKCDDGYVGGACTCDTRNFTSIKNMENYCRSDRDNSICSNRGDCECGQCYCNIGYDGKHCECEICLGCDLDLAYCDCGECVCKYGFYGSKCQCKDGFEKCVSPNNETCSNRGECYCGECDCNEDYTGKYCELSEKDNKLCAYYEPCVKCLIHQQMGDKCQDVEIVCQGVNATFIDEEIETLRCLVRMTDKDGIPCDHYFKYNTEVENELSIQMGVCTPVDKATVGLFISAATILLGLLGVLWWKLWTMYKDKQDFLRFQKEVEAYRMSTNVNPIYKDPIRKYSIPKTYEDDYE